jgi:hypothetical protein
MALEQVLGLYHAVASIWKGEQAVRVDPASLRPSQEEIELQLLAIGSPVDHDAGNTKPPARSAVLGVSNAVGR